MKLIKHFFLIALLTVSSATAVEFHFGSDDGLDEIAALTTNMVHEDPKIFRGEQNSSDLLNSLNAVDAVKDPFYNYTRPIRRRSLLDSNLFTFNRNYYFDKGYCITPFFTQTYKAHLYDDKTALNGYIDMVQHSILKIIDDGEFTDIDIPPVISLFTNIKVQERQIGTMFQFYVPYKQWDITFMFPFLYQENNFYLTRKEIKRIENEPLFKDFQGDVIEFAQEHLISDKLGIGDLRINFEKIIRETETFKFTGGFEITLPTAFSFTKGLFGNSFNLSKANPPFDLHTDFIAPYAAGSKQQAVDNGEKLLLNALDRLTTILLEHPLGNNRHIGIGMFFKQRINFNNDWYLQSKIKAELLLPATERRFFKETISSAEVDAIQDTIANDVSNDAEARVQIDKLNNSFIKKFFPQSYKTKIFPGALFQATTHIVKEYDNWTLRFGSDLWYHTQELIGSIDAQSDTLNNLDIKAGKKSFGYQQDFFLGIDRHHKEGAYFDWSFYTNYTAFSYGIGKTFTLGIKISHEF